MIMSNQFCHSRTPELLGVEGGSLRNRRAGRRDKVEANLSWGQKLTSASAKHVRYRVLGWKISSGHHPQVDQGVIAVQLWPGLDQVLSRAEPLGVKETIQPGCPGKDFQSHSPGRWLVRHLVLVSAGSLFLMTYVIMDQPFIPHPLWVLVSLSLSGAGEAK